MPATPELPAASFRLADCEIHISRSELRFDDGRLERLQPKQVEVLVQLALQPGVVVSREQLIERIWQGNIYVGEKALTNAVFRLRKALAGSAAAEAIETLPKRGYQLLLLPEWPGVLPTTGQTAGSEPQDGATSPVEVQDGAVIEPTSVQRQRKPLVLALLLAGVLGLMLLLRWWPASPPAAPQLLTGEPGLEMYPQPLPDGSFVYLALDGEGRRDLFRRWPSAPPQALTKDGRSEGPPALDRNGTQLYYSSRLGREACELRRLTLSNGRVETLAPCPAMGDLRVVVFADSRRIAVVAQDGGIYLWSAQQPGQWQALPCQQGCTGPRRAHHLALSPDQHWLAWSQHTESGREELLLHDLRQHSDRRLLGGLEANHGLVFAHDGRSVFYGAEQARRLLGFQLDLASGQSRQLPVSGFAAPALAQDGRLLYHDYSVRRALLQRPLRHDAPVAPHPFLDARAESQQSFHSAHYSATSDRLVYVSNASGQDEIWLSDASGQQRRPLSDAGQARLPRWSPDGQRIAYLHRQSDGRDAVLLLAADRGQLQRVTTAFPAIRRLDWSTDGNALLLQVRDQLYRQALQGGAPQHLLSGVRMAQALPDGRLLLSREDQPGLWLAQGDGQAMRRLLEGPTPSDGWDADAEGVCYSQTIERWRQLSCLEWGGQVRVLQRLPLDPLASAPQLTLMRKQQKLLLSQQEAAQADIKAIQAGF